MNDRHEAITVPGGLYWQSRFFAASRGFWRLMGNLETAVLREDLEDIEIDRPLYVTSLARAGTTIVTEMLEHHPDLTCHHYSDFPNCWTPYWRNYLLVRTRRQAPPRIERAHRDRIVVSQDSPEAVEEVLWMGFFEGLHDQRRCNVLDASARNALFDRFYADHIRKLLAVRHAPRYLAKGNYNLSRLAYLHGLFPDARFLIPVRSPEQHIASLAKQHALFSRAHARDGRIGRQLAMSGHFEFGPLRRFVNFGDEAACRAIAAAWAAGREVEGWAIYWAATYRFLLAQLSARPSTAERCLLFRYEELCNDSAPVIDALLAHCGLDSGPFAAARLRYESELRLPDYYSAGFSDEERGLIAEHCGAVHGELLGRCWRP